jgi:hypothetical protein
MAAAFLVPPNCPTNLQPIRFQTSAEVDGVVAKLGDVADLSNLPPEVRARAATMAVARHGSAPVQTLEGIQRRLRAQMPILRCWLAASEPTTIRIAYHPSRPASLPAREWAWQTATDVQPGDEIHLTVNAGPVRIDRQVRALQPARAGQRLFVRDADGNTFPALLGEGKR